MRLLGLLLLPLVLGLALGWGLAAWEVGPCSSFALPKVEGQPAGPNGDGGEKIVGPRAIASSAEFDFGVLAPHEVSKHAFTVRNAGRDPLVLTQGESSCSCTVGSIGKAVLQPGETTEVTLQWHGTMPGPFRQSATIRTNDFVHPNLTFVVFGRISPRLAVVPEHVALGRISASQAKQVDVRIYAFQDEDLRITSHEWLDAATREYFTFSERKMEPLELVENNAQSGRVVTLSLQSGLPRGRLQQRIRIGTSAAEQGQLEIPIEAVVEGDVSVVGRGWDADSSTWTLGAVESGKGLQADLILLVRGPQPEPVTFRLRSVTPDALRITLVEPSDAAGGGLRQVPLKLEIPQGAPAMSHLGDDRGPLGEIVLETTHPEVPELRMSVRFAIADP